MLHIQESEYLFNGDVVDRGQNGAEVLFTVLAFKCLFPKQVNEPFLLGGFPMPQAKNTIWL